ncbi:hypothetical protein ES702_07438 [subsurface metagenome]
MNIIQAIKNKNLFGKFFKDLESWRAWIVYLKAIFCIKMDKNELALFKEMTGGRGILTQEVKESYLICGRRSGKSFITSIIAIYLGIFRDYSKHLAAGETGVIMVVAVNKSQAAIILGYIKGIINDVPLFKEMVTKELSEELHLKNGIVIRVKPCNYKSIRGFTIVSCICEEASFWNVEGMNPDHQVVEAVRPAMATIENSKLLCLSSPYSRTGIMWEAFRDYYGKDDDEILVWRAKTRDMNPTVSQLMIDRAFKRDPAASEAEWNAEFRKDRETFLRLEAIEACVKRDCFENPYVLGQHYQAFIDPSGGGSDGFAIAIGHAERRGNKRIKVLDLLRVKMPPFDPAAVVKEYADILNKYKIRRVYGDRYSAQWNVRAFQNLGIAYKYADKNKSQLYIDLESMINCGEVELLDHKILIRELRQLERKTGTQRGDVVDHPARLHDDAANVCAGVMSKLSFVKPCGVWGNERDDRKEKIDVHAIRPRRERATIHDCREYQT